MVVRLRHDMHATPPVRACRKKKTQPSSTLIRISHAPYSHALRTHISLRLAAQPSSNLVALPNNGTCMPSSIRTRGPGISFTFSRFGRPVCSHINSSWTWPGVMPLCWEPQRNFHSERDSDVEGACFAS